MCAQASKTVGFHASFCHPQCQILVIDLPPHLLPYPPKPFLTSTSIQPPHYPLFLFTTLSQNRFYHFCKNKYYCLSIYITYEKTDPNQGKIICSEANKQHNHYPAIRLLSSYHIFFLLCLSERNQAISTALHIKLLYFTQIDKDKIVSSIHLLFVLCLFLSSWA